MAGRRSPYSAPSDGTGSSASIAGGDTAGLRRTGGIRWRDYGIYHLATTAFDNSAETTLGPAQGGDGRRMCRLNYQAGRSPHRIHVGVLAVQRLRPDAPDLRVGVLTRQKSRLPAKHLV
jgi:hypothetical protein